MTVIIENLTGVGVPAIIGNLTGVGVTAIIENLTIIFVAKFFQLHVIHIGFRRASH